MMVLMQWAQRVLAWLVGEALLFGSRAWTGVRPLWIGAAPRLRQRVYFANHGSHGDFVMIWASLPPSLRVATRPVAGQDYWLASAMRRFAASMVFRALLINRHPQAGEPSPVDQMAQTLSAGESLILFPEGTRNTTEATLLPFKSGLYHLSRHKPDVEFVPVWVDNIRRVMPKGELIPVPLVCTVSFGAPLSLDPHEGKEAFLQRARDAVLSLRPVESIGN
ncbi:1-acyl-sn-glycerol-3-phosphate acyltransferase [Aquabacterium sp.]|uniref:lysophospholipid acyltransferase family protein n=1 Tax=Aquabacterium sp. TaxID=1872578 RepID=UPI0025C72D79|nr:lysophospholipid acyltransferase family protein [Aquabacterium sp.]